MPEHSLRYHLGRTFKLGLPLVGGQLAQITINTTDVVMLGWSGTFNLAAGVLGTQAFMLLYLFGVGFSHAIIPLAAKAVGQDDPKSVRRAVRMGFWMVSLYALPALVLLWNIEAILLVLGQDKDVARLAADYVMVAMWALFPALWTMVLRNFFSSLESANIVFWAVIPGILINILLNYMLIFGRWGAPEMGVVGAAWASLATATLIFLIMLSWYLLKSEYSKYSLLSRIWRADWFVFRQIFVIGLPISITIFAEVSMFIGASVLMGLIGVRELAAHGIAMQLAAITFMVPLGLSNAATVRIGNAFGRKNVFDIRMASYAAIIFALGFGCLSAIMFWLAPEFLVNLFLDYSDADAPFVAIIAVQLVLIAAAYQIFDALQVLGAGLLRGFQDTAIPMVISLICYGPMGIAFGALLGFYFNLGAIGIWIGLCVGLLTASIMLLSRHFILIAGFERRGFNM